MSTSYAVLDSPPPVDAVFPRRRLPTDSPIIDAAIVPEAAEWATPFMPTDGDLRDLEPLALLKIIASDTCPIAIKFQILETHLRSKANVAATDEDLHAVLKDHLLMDLINSRDFGWLACDLTNYNVIEILRLILNGMEEPALEGKEVERNHEAIGFAEWSLAVLDSLHRRLFEELDPLALGSFRAFEAILVLPRKFLGFDTLHAYIRARPSTFDERILPLWSNFFDELEIIRDFRQLLPEHPFIRKKADEPFRSYAARRDEYPQFDFFLIAQAGSSKVEGTLLSTLPSQADIDAAADVGVLGFSSEVYVRPLLALFADASVHPLRRITAMESLVYAFRSSASSSGSKQAKEVAVRISAMLNHPLFFTFLLTSPDLPCFMSSIYYLVLTEHNWRNESPNALPGYPAALKPSSRGTTVAQLIKQTEPCIAAGYASTLPLISAFLRAAARAMSADLSCFKTQEFSTVFIFACSANPSSLPATLPAPVVNFILQQRQNGVLAMLDLLDPSALGYLLPDDFLLQISMNFYSFLAQLKIPTTDPFVQTSNDVLLTGFMSAAFKYLLAVLEIEGDPEAAASRPGVTGLIAPMTGTLQSMTPEQLKPYMGYLFQKGFYRSISMPLFTTISASNPQLLQPYISSLINLVADADTPTPTDMHFVPLVTALRGAVFSHPADLLADNAALYTSLRTALLKNGTLPTATVVRDATGTPVGQVHRPEFPLNAVPAQLYGIEMLGSIADLPSSLDGPDTIPGTASTRLAAAALFDAIRGFMLLPIDQASDDAAYTAHPPAPLSELQESAVLSAVGRVNAMLSGRDEPAQYLTPQDRVFLDQIAGGVPEAGGWVSLDVHPDTLAPWTEEDEGEPLKVVVGRLMRIRSPHFKGVVKALSNEVRGLSMEKMFKQMEGSFKQLGIDPTDPFFGAVKEALDKDELMSFDVMLSYNWSHQPTVIRIRDSLMDRGLRVWLDLEQMAGNVYGKMAEAVLGSNVIVPCLTAAYEASGNCKRELGFAADQTRFGKKIVPVRLENGPFTWSALITAGLLYTQITDRELADAAAWDAAMDGLAREIRSALEQQRIETEARAKGVAPPPAKMAVFHADPDAAAAAAAAVEEPVQRREEPAARDAPMGVSVDAVESIADRLDAFERKMVSVFLPAALEPLARKIDAVASVPTPGPAEGLSERLAAAEARLAAATDAMEARMARLEEAFAERVAAGGEETSPPAGATGPVTVVKAEVGVLGHRVAHLETTVAAQAKMMKMLIGLLGVKAQLTTEQEVGTTREQ
ncbi:hypothetical protein HDU96_009909 [Phlyctochytrium bullatum]|nr:hypothetical protein HDU96_009909 [Phlyctochytrium bullatum]